MWRLTEEDAHIAPLPKRYYDEIQEGHSIQKYLLENYIHYREAILIYRVDFLCTL